MKNEKTSYKKIASDEEILVGLFVVAIFDVFLW
jgi:hypothetical protein